MVNPAPTVALVGQRLDLPSFRLRVGVLQPFLEERGFRVHVTSIPRKPEWFRVWRLARIWRESDAIVFAKLKLLVGELGFVKKRCPTWLLDVDDAIMFAKPNKHGDEPSRALWRQRRFYRMVEHCRITVTGSGSLAEMVGRDHGRVEVLHTPVDLSRSPVANHDKRPELRLAWIGQPGNLPYLADLAPVFRELLAEGIALQVRVICSELPEMPGVPCQLVPWSLATQEVELAACDIGIAPLPDDDWTRGKGAYRSIQYAAAGLATVASPVGANREVVLPNQTGLWADSPIEWRDALLRLARDVDFRRQLGGAARERALQFDLPRFAERYIAWINELISVKSK